MVENNLLKKINPRPCHNLAYMRNYIFQESTSVASSMNIALFLQK